MSFNKVLVFAGVAICFQLCGCSQLEMMNGDLSRIVNGNIASNAQFPYAISLQQLSLLNVITRGHVCGGALITLQHAITSGSCLYVVNGTTYTLKTPSQYRVFAGSALIYNDTSSETYRAVSLFTPHPSFVPPSYANNIGIITVILPFLSTFVTPLPVNSAVPADNTQCTVAGWGATLAGAQTSVNLLYVNRITMNQTTCSTMAAGVGAPAIDSNMLCAGHVQTFTPSCTNDTGNALVCGNSLVGVLSWSNFCNLASTFEVYSRTANYSTWVHAVTGGAGRSAPLAAVTVVMVVVTWIVGSFL